MNQIESFPPLASPNSRVLILGSMPGQLSLDRGQYYAHPRNTFWAIMGKLFDAGPDVPYEDRTNRLKLRGVALWDVLQSCIRLGSLDAHIKDEVPNDFASFFSEHASITHVFFNGRKAETAYRRHVLHTLTGDTRVYTRLPSTSPAHAGVTFEGKVREWATISETPGRWRENITAAS